MWVSTLQAAETSESCLCSHKDSLHKDKPAQGKTRYSAISAKCRLVGICKSYIMAHTHCLHTTQ